MKSFIQALIKIPQEKDMELFLQDLCTPGELSALEERWAIVQLLEQGLSYREIAQELGSSTATVTRVARCLHRPGSGYRKILNKLEKNQRTIQ